jgi:LysM repeat protein
MKLKLSVLTLVLLTFSAKVFANTLADSVGVENHDGKQVILHKLDAKDNYYSIARRYKVSPKTIIAYNNNANLMVGSIIKVPTDRPFATNTPAKTAQQGQPVVHQTAPPQQQPANGGTQYKVSAGETLYSIAKRFNTTPENLVSLNGLSSNTITPGQVLIVQAAAATTTTTQTAQPQQQPVQQPANTNANAGTQYKVSVGETLYSIAKRFNTTPENLMHLNGLTSNAISPGQTLIVQAATATTPTQMQQTSVQQQQVTRPTDLQAKRDSPAPVANQDSSNLASHPNANKYGLFEKDEKGVATWMDDDGLDPNKKLVLHRTAPIGTVIKITNIMTNRTTFAKVVGRFTDNEQTKDVIIVMTKNVAEALGALDKRFQVNLSYGVPQQQ